MYLATPFPQQRYKLGVVKYPLNTFSLQAKTPEDWAVRDKDSFNKHCEISIKTGNTCVSKLQRMVKYLNSNNTRKQK